ncbi:16477_t:CDS:2 [Funneliformis mosseae]|uniref:16477_t:CDS:1 n=1 Tax=Funneliformis mosseae TaxID=27381 RepID=A0A9N9BEP1_FUNMO|nr:16477_t:CDS:2 [Funneliformis mosseae]
MDEQTRERPSLSHRSKFNTEDATRNGRVQPAQFHRYANDIERPHKDDFLLTRYSTGLMLVYRNEHHGNSNP